MRYRVCFRLILGSLELRNSVALFLLLTSLCFMISFLFISRNNDMIGALKSLLPSWLKEK